MLRLWARRKSQVVAASQTDTVLFGVSLPSDSVIHDIKIKMEILSANAAQEVDSISVFPWAMEAWILPIDDPDATADFDDIWDTMVPKDTDVQTMDLDQETAVVSVFYEPGEVDWKKVFDVGIRPQMLMHRHGDLSINNTEGIVFIDSQTPFEPKWQPGLNLRWRDPKRYRIKEPSVMLIGVGIPTYDDQTTTVEAPLAENEWGRVKYMGDTVKMAMMDVLGLIETGAETPWEDATDLLQRHLEPDILEVTSGFYGSSTLTFHGELIVDHSVVGELGVSSISTGRG